MRHILLIIAASVVFGLLAYAAWYFDPTIEAEAVPAPAPRKPPAHSMLIPDEPVVAYWVKEDGKNVLYHFRQSEIRR